MSGFPFQPIRGKTLITSCGVPKTGQTTMYAAGDDGDIQAGWWRGRNVSNNKSRFWTAAFDGEQLVIDRATNLVWPKAWDGDGGNGGGSLTWASGVSWASNLNFAGFTDWRLPNVNELVSLINWGTTNPCLWSGVFTGVAASSYFTSTTYSGGTTNAWIVSMVSGAVTLLAKTDSKPVVAVRDYKKC